MMKLHHAVSIEAGRPVWVSWRAIAMVELSTIAGARVSLLGADGHFYVQESVEQVLEMQERERTRDVGAAR